MNPENYILLVCILCAIICLVAMTITVILYWLINRQIKKAIEEHYGEEKKE